MKNLVFATANKDKLKEVRNILKVNIKGAELDIEEIQSLDVERVAIQKAKDYFKELKSPLFVEDIGLSFKALGGLPGTYIKDFSKAIGNQGLTSLLSKHKDKSAQAILVLAYANNKGKIKIFKGVVNGKISNNPKGNKGFGWDPIFIPHGSKKTFGQMDEKEKNRYSMRTIALQKFAKYLKTA